MFNKSNLDYFKEAGRQPGGLVAAEQSHGFS